MPDDLPTSCPSLARMSRTVWMSSGTSTTWRSVTSMVRATICLKKRKQKLNFEDFHFHPFIDKNKIKVINCVLLSTIRVENRHWLRTRIENNFYFIKKSCLPPFSVTEKSSCLPNIDIFHGHRLITYRQICPSPFF